MSYYSTEELQSLGLGGYGTNVMLSRKSSLYGNHNLFLGDNVRIDDFTLISAKETVKIGSFVHISAYAAIYGGGGVEINDFAGLSPRATIFSESDDFSGESLIHPFFASEFKPNHQKAKVIVSRFCQLGVGTTVLPGCIVGEGSVTGAHSLVLSSLEDWGIYAGIPVSRIADRSKKVINLAKMAVCTGE